MHCHRDMGTSLVQAELVEAIEDRLEIIADCR
jgi:hypothetical protein